MRHVIKELIEVYTDTLIEGYEDCCCQQGMYEYSGCIGGEVEYGTN